MAIFYPFLGQFSHFSVIFPPFSRWGRKSIFRPFFFPISGRRADSGSVQGTRDRNERTSFGALWTLSRILCEISRGHFLGNCRTKTCKKFRQNFAELLACLLQKFTTSSLWEVLGRTDVMCKISVS